MKMVFNYEFNRVSVAVFDDDWNETGWLWKKAEFEQEFLVSLPDVRHITIDEINNVETVIGDVPDKEGLLRNIKSKKGAIVQAVFAKQQAQQAEMRNAEDITQSVRDLESAVAYLIKSLNVDVSADWKERLLDKVEAREVKADGAQIM